MPALSIEMLRAGLGLKLEQVKRATRSYLRDRAHLATHSVTSWMAVAGLYAAAGVFLVAACFVAVAALYRWIEIHYGQFQAFGAVGAVFVVMAAACAGFAARTIRRPGPQFPSLTSRLRVAIRANPILPLPSDTQAPDAVSEAAFASRAGARRKPVNNAGMQAGLVAVAVLLGWAAARRMRLRQHEEA